MIALKRRVVPLRLREFELNLILVSLTEVSGLLFAVLVGVELAVSSLSWDIAILVLLIIKTPN